MMVRELKKGMVVYECERGRNIRCECLEDAREDVNPTEGKDGHSCRVMTEHGDVELFQTRNENLHHYGPRLYTHPQYA